jgi:excisionase family DNA binding protein
MRMWKRTAFAIAGQHPQSQATQRNAHCRGLEGYKLTEPGYYTVPEVAAMLHRTAGTIRGWIRTGKLAAFRPVAGGGYLIKQSTIDAMQQG